MCMGDRPAMPAWPAGQLFFQKLAPGEGRHHDPGRVPGAPFLKTNPAGRPGRHGGAAPHLSFFLSLSLFLSLSIYKYVLYNIFYIS